MKRIITAIAIFFCFCTLVGAQTDITRETLVAEGDSVKVSFSVDSERGVPKRRNHVHSPADILDMYTCLLCPAPTAWMSRSVNEGLP